MSRSSLAQQNSSFPRGSSDYGQLKMVPTKTFCGAAATGKIIYTREGRIDREWTYDMWKHNSGVYHIQILSTKGLTHSKIIKN